MESVIPNFLGIGAPKCGTTWISEVLRTHPDIYVAHGKELRFFSSNEQYIKGIDWYLSNFKKGVNANAIGEFSVSYMNGREEIAKMIYDLNPKMKLIVAIRNPIERAFSHYRWNLQLEKNLPSFLEALRIDPNLVTYSMYYKNMIPFWTLFPDQQIHFIIFDDIIKRPKFVQSNLYNFLSVDDNFNSKLENTVIGKTIVTRNRAFERMRVKIYNKAIEHDFAYVITLIKKTYLSNLYRRINNKKGLNMQINRYEKMEAYSYFKEDLDNFYKKTNLNIESWFIGD